MPRRLLIRNGLVIDPAQDLESGRDVLIEDGRIAEVRAGLAARPGLKGVPTLDASGRWVVPGLIDMHVHLREPGREEDETIASGTATAAAGGFTTVLAMPNTEPPLDSPALALRAQAALRRDAQVNVLLAGCATLGQKGERLADIKGMAEAGVRAVSDDGRPVMDGGLMRGLLELTRRFGLACISHCEDLSLSRGAPVNEGRASRRLGLPGHPWAAETVMVLRDIALAELTGAPVHIAHVSAARSVDAVRRAKAAGLPVTAEAAPHHFCLCDADIPGRDADFKMNPPLRSAADRDALREGLADGTIDAVASDHAPHAPGKKARGLCAAPFGVIGLETSLGLVLTVLAGRRIIGRKRLVELMSSAPARILGLKRKGTLRQGSDADVTVIDPDTRWTVPDRFVSRSRNSPFAGMRLTGLARAAIVGGRIVHAL